MGPGGKWIEGLSPEGSVVDAARASLAARLTAVVHWLPLAAYHASQDLEHVHRLRVSTRRAVAALRLYRDCIPAKRFRWVKKRLKKIRRAAGAARDLDVFIDRLEREYGERAAPLLADARRHRDVAQPDIVVIAEKCRRNDRFVRKIGRLLDCVRQPPLPDETQAPPSFRDWAGSKLQETAEPFFAAVPPTTSDTSALHQFRIRAKALRYAMELLAPAMGPELRAVQYPIVEELQERLGKIQDGVTGSARLRQSARQAGSADERTQLEALALEEEKRLAQSIAEFHDWWNDERIAALRSGLLSGHQPAGAQTVA